MSLDRRYMDVGDFPNPGNIEELKKLFIRIKERYHLDSSELLNKLEEKEALIPASVFYNRL